MRSLFLYLLLMCSLPAFAGQCSRASINYSSAGLGPNVLVYYGGESGRTLEAAATEGCIGTYQWNSGSPRCMVPHPPYPDDLVSITVGLSWDGPECDPPVTQPKCPHTPGSDRVLNYTIGWSPTTFDGQSLGDLIGGAQLPPSQVSDGSCKHGVGAPVMCYVSTVPTDQGLYRASCDFQTVILGDSDPNAVDERTDPQSPDMQCPGGAGTVNGKPVCLDAPSNTIQSWTPPVTPIKAGNPAAGEMPTEGEGSGVGPSGRTPNSGPGGNAGGPSGAVIPSPGSGSESGEIEFPDPCGAPGQPSCSVKLDETGTPSDGSGAFDTSGTGVDQGEQTILDKIGDLQLWTPGTWSWTFQLPTGCQPLPMFLGVVVDPCQYLEEVHSIMSLVWVLTGIAGLFVIFAKAD